MSGRTEERMPLGKQDEGVAKSDIGLMQVRSLVDRSDLLFSQAAVVALEVGVADKSFEMSADGNCSAILRTGPEGRVELTWSSEEASVAITRYDGDGDKVVEITQFQKLDSQGIVVEFEFDGDIIKTETAPKESGAGFGVLPLHFEGNWTGMFKKIISRARRNGVQYTDLQDATRILSSALANTYQYVDSTDLAWEFLEGVVD